ncbi:MAG: dTDP-glucose 4,6-dehydratase [Acidimicrobiaceae bacterium]|nr:dTDP-glucose 4,6-dehydratase [Acidimicrobiaceae bacterium]
MLGIPHSNLPVLVTGGAGFIGAVTVRRLIEDGHRVTVADNGNGSRHAAARRAITDAEWVDVDLHDVDLVDLMSGFAYVVHLAGRPGVQTSWRMGFVDHLHDNILVTQRVLEAAIVTRPRQVLLASSSSVYGDVPAGLVSEGAPLSPLSPYGVSKAATEMLMDAYVKRGVPAAALRLFTVYGRGQRPDMALHRIIDAGLGGPAFELRGSGRQVRDFTHVDDIAAAIAAVVGTSVDPGTVLNIGSGRPVELRALIAAVEHHLDRPVPVVKVAAAPGDPMRTAADTSLARTILGWTPTTTLEAGIADQVLHHQRRTAVRTGVADTSCAPNPAPVHAWRVA